MSRWQIAAYRNSDEFLARTWELEGVTADELRTALGRPADDPLLGGFALDEASARQVVGTKLDVPFDFSAFSYFVEPGSDWELPLDAAPDKYV